MQLLECTRDALTLTKQTTKIIRQAWEQSQRQALLASLALVNPLSTLQQQSNVGGAQNFIDQLNSEFNQRSAGDNNQAKEEKKRTEISEAELIEMIK